VATGQASLPVAWRLDLVREWAEDRARRKKAGVPEEVKFQTKPEMARDQIRPALASDLPRGWCWPMSATARTRAFAKA